jgi:hypothetical protein
MEPSKNGCLSFKNIHPWFGPKAKLKSLFWAHTHINYQWVQNGLQMGYKWVTKVKSYITSVEVHP